MGIFKGSWKSLINQIDMETANNMTREELSPIISKLSSVANKRIKRMLDKGVKNIYTREFEMGEKFGAKGKSVGKLKKEFGRLLNFLSQDVYSLSGLHKLQDEIRAGAARVDVNIPEMEINDFANEMEKGLIAFIHGKELGYWERMQWDSNQALEYARAIAISNPNLSNIELNSKVDDLFYEFARKQAEDYRRNENVDTSDFFVV